MNSTLHGTRRTVLARRVAVACSAGVLLLGVTACGSDDPKALSDSSGTSGTSGSTGQQGGDGPTQQQRPGANGKVAAVSGSTAQVQSRDNGQVAVSWTASTAFTKQVAAKLADVGVDDCVMVAPVADDTAPDTSGSSGSGTSTPPTAVTAASVRITEKVDGSCSPARGGPGGGAGGGPGGGASGGPQLQGSSGGGAPPAGARPQIRGFGGAFGTVKAVSASTFVVSTSMPTADSSTGTTDVTVTVTGATTYETTAKGAAGDVKAGVCVNAEGSTDDTGAVKATRIAVTPAVDGECTGGMVRFSRGSDTSGGKAS